MSFLSSRGSPQSAAATANSRSPAQTTPGHRKKTRASMVSVYWMHPKKVPQMKKHSHIGIFEVGLQ